MQFGINQRVLTAGGGSFKIATMSVQAPNGDLSDVDDRFEVGLEVSSKMTKT